MPQLNKNEQISLIAGAIILIFAVSADIILPLRDQILVIIIWAGASIIFSTVVLYTFLLQPIASNQFEGDNRFFIPSKDTFKPFISKSSKLTKKTQLRGHCGVCNKQILLGFTCSYCHGYFCPNHRLPEKHNCTRLR
jgi:hypothetical protein